MIVLTIGLVLAGFLQVLVLKRQAGVMAQQATIMTRQTEIMDGSLRLARESNALTKEATELTRQALHLTERADLSLDGIQADTPGVGPTVMLLPSTTFTLTFKNRGRTRANQITSEFWIGVPDAHTIEPPPIPSTVLGAGDTLLLAFPSMNSFLTQETFNAVHRADVPFRFEGEIRYLDVFGQPHCTRCSGTLVPESCCFRVDRNEAD